MSTDLPSTAYPSPESAARFYEAVVQRLRAAPGIEQASVSQGLPLQGVQWGEYMSLPGVKDFLVVRLKFVDSRYFETLQIPVESGRGIEDRDRGGSPPVVVLNQELARSFSSTFGIVNPVGRTVGVDVPGYGPIPESFVKVQIVGVIRSERTSGLHAPPELVAYVPFAQAPRQDIKLVVRTASDPASLMPAIREAVRQIDPRLPLGDVMTMEQVKQQSMLWATQPTWVVGAFAGVAALLEHAADLEPPIVVVLSGGNIDPLLLSKLLRHGLRAAGPVAHVVRRAHSPSGSRRPQRGRLRHGRLGAPGHRRGVVGQRH